MTLQRAIPFLFLLMACAGCEAPFPPTQKPNLPADHIESIKTAMHKPGFDFPYKQESGCATSSCHGDDLTGGVAQVDERITIAPSCFQCHETKWQDDE